MIASTSSSVSQRVVGRAAPCPLVGRRSRGCLALRLLRRAATGLRRDSVVTARPPRRVGTLRLALHLTAGCSISIPPRGSPLLGAAGTAARQFNLARSGKRRHQHEFCFVRGGRGCGNPLPHASHREEQLRKMAAHGAAKFILGAPSAQQRGQVSRVETFSSAESAPRPHRPSFFPCLPCFPLPCPKMVKHTSHIVQISKSCN